MQKNKFLKCENECIKPYSDYYLGKMYLDKDGKLFNPEKGIEYMDGQQKQETIQHPLSLE